MDKLAIHKRLRPVREYLMRAAREAAKSFTDDAVDGREPGDWIILPLRDGGLDNIVEDVRAWAEQMRAEGK